MNTETIYNVLLDQPRQIDGKTWHGLSYQLTRDEAGKIEVREHGWPTKLTIYEADGPELDALDEATVKAAIEAALPVDADYVIPQAPIPYIPIYTAEEWVQNYFSSLEIIALTRLEQSILQQGKVLGPKMQTCKDWLEAMMFAQPSSTFLPAPYTYSEASIEAYNTLNS